MESDNEFRLGLPGSAPESPPPMVSQTSEECLENASDSIQANGVSGSLNGSEATPAASGLDSEAGVMNSGQDEDVAEGEGDAMELEEPLNSSGLQTAHDTATSYVGDNCLSTPTNTESNSPQMDIEPDSEGVLEGAGDEEGRADSGDSPDQSVSSAGTGGAQIAAHTDQENDLESDLSLIADVASSDDIAPTDVSSGTGHALQTTGISSSTADAGDGNLDNLDNPAISSSNAEASDLLPSTSNLMAADALNHLSTPLVAHSHQHPETALANMEGHVDTSAPPLVQVLSLQRSPSPPRQMTQYARPLVTNSTISHTAVSSSNAAMGVLHQVSSTCTELPGADESAVSSSMNSNGNTPVNSAGTRDAADALATLASAALNRQHSTNEIKQEKDEEPWYTVGIVKGTSFTVQNYISDPNIDLSKLSIDNIPDLSGFPVLPLDPGTGYKFRVAAINSCGRGDFGEESAFKTCVPGYPGAPSDIKISKSAEGAHLSWEPPQASPEGIFEYSVYLAVRPMNPAKQDAPVKSQLTFVRVYCGKSTTCIVAQSSLSNAHVDSSIKPAIIFRIAARNEKGYGPATQVRWLQESKTTGVKRILSDGRPAAGPPSKQQKSNMGH